MILWPSNIGLPRHCRRKSVIIGSLIAIYVFVFTLITKFPIVDEGKLRNFPVPYYFSESSHWNYVDRVIFFPLVKPLEFCSVLEYRNDLSGSKIGAPTIWERMF